MVFIRHRETFQRNDVNKMLERMIPDKSKSRIQIHVRENRLNFEHPQRFTANPYQYGFTKSMTKH